MHAAARAIAASALTAWLVVLAPAAFAQTAEPSSPAKKELVARVLKLQQPGVENLGRTLAEQPALQLAAPVRAAIARLPQDKREAVARQIEADVQRYAEEVVPIVRDRAVALAPPTLGPMIEQRFTEEELRQLVAILESPINARYQALGLEMQRALGTKLVAETRAAVDPKFKALEQSVQSRLRAAFAAANAASAAGTTGAGSSAPGARVPAASGAAAGK
ncbi:MAG: hypothetical protein HZC37_30635 [Burkholderiales bacterium]|nr:hypothetical protein [Burkholderiales bacterium]